MRIENLRDFHLKRGSKITNKPYIKPNSLRYNALDKKLIFNDFKRYVNDKMNHLKNRNFIKTIKYAKFNLSETLDKNEVDYGEPKVFTSILDRGAKTFDRRSKSMSKVSSRPLIDKKHQSFMNRINDITLQNFQSSDEHSKINTVHDYA